MAFWVERGRKLHLRYSRRDGPGNPVTVTLASWGTIDEASVDLSDPVFIAALREKAKPHALAIPTLTASLEEPRLFLTVPRSKSRAVARAAGSGGTAWDGTINWQFGKEFWKNLTTQLVSKVGANTARRETTTSGALSAAMAAYRAEIEAAGRDLRRRLIWLEAEAKKSKSGILSTAVTTEVTNAITVLALDDELDQLTRDRVKKQFKRLAAIYHPDVHGGGVPILFLQVAHARDVLIAFLDASGKE